jgi:hypothetical protein
MGSERFPLFRLPRLPGVKIYTGFMASGKRTRWIAALLAAIVCCGCTQADSKFDSKRWKAGRASTRGSMVYDLMGHDLLHDKSPSEVKELLGKPDNCTIGNGPDMPVCDDAKVGSFGYAVVSNPRCYFWKCQMDVVFGADSHRVKDVAVSD